MVTPHLNRPPPAAPNAFYPKKRRPLPFITSPPPAAFSAQTHSPPLPPHSHFFPSFNPLLPPKTKHKKTLKNHFLSFVCLFVCFLCLFYKTGLTLNIWERGLTGLVFAMAPSFDCVSNLLCADEDNTFFDDSIHYGPTMELHDQDHDHDHDQNMCFRHPDTGLPLLSEECLEQMLQNECHHLPSGDYFTRLTTSDSDFGARNEALHWILKVREHFGFGPLCEYLSINYLDRFLSSYELPKGKAWTMQLLAVACLSLAAKIEETEVPLSLDLQVGGSKYIFEARTIQRMEVLVLSTLRWRMQAITPFSFLDYFLYKVNDDERPEISSIMRSIQIISSKARGVDLLEFRPSEVAAAVAICAMRETKTVNTERAISLLSQHVKEERVLECLNMIKEVASPNRRPQSPIGVWEATLCMSYRSEESNSSCASSSCDVPPDCKRRKLNNNNSGEELL